MTEEQGQPEVSWVFSKLDEAIGVSQEEAEYLEGRARNYQILASLRKASTDRLIAVRDQAGAAIEQGNIDTSSPILGYLGGTASSAIHGIGQREDRTFDDDMYITMSGIAFNVTLENSLSKFISIEPEDVPLPAVTFGDLQSITEYQIEAPLDMEIIENQVAENLARFAPHYPGMFRGAWEVFRSEIPDKNREAAHSMRELIDQLLRQLAPDKQMEEAGVDKWKREEEYIYTRDQRIDFISHGLDESKRQTLVDLYSALNQPRRELTGQAHKPREILDNETEVELEHSTNALWQLLAIINPDEEE